MCKKVHKSIILRKNDYLCNIKIDFYKVQQRMENVIEIPKNQIIMAFVATCIEATARLLNTSYKEVYQRMKHVGMIEQYIIPHYETLHSESRENIAEGIAECLNEWEGRK